MIQIFTEILPGANMDAWCSTLILVALLAFIYYYNLDLFLAGVILFMSVLQGITETSATSVSGTRRIEKTRLTIEEPKGIEVWNQYILLRNHRRIGGITRTNNRRNQWNHDTIRRSVGTRITQRIMRTREL